MDLLLISNLDVAASPEYQPKISSRVKSDSDSAIKIVQYPVFDHETHVLQLKLHYDEHKTTTVCPQPYKQEDRNYYGMKASKHGVTLIINNLNFRFSKIMRTQTERDEYNLIQTFYVYFLGYRPIVCHSLTLDEIYNIFGKFLANSNDLATAKVENDSFVCCIMSHDRREYSIIGSDNMEISLWDIVRLTSESKILRGKPKVFFTALIQGEPDQMCHLWQKVTRGQSAVDTYVCSTVASGKRAFRDITQLCKTLCEYGT